MKRIVFEAQASGAGNDRCVQELTNLTPSSERLKQPRLLGFTECGSRVTFYSIVDLRRLRASCELQINRTRRIVVEDFPK